jgi:hypothetical protein
MSTIRKTISGTIAALALGATVLASATPASADWRGHRRHGGGGGWGAPVAAGIIGGLALGALAASSARAQTRTYYAPAPAYVPSYSYGGCYDMEKPVYNRWGEFRGYRLVTVCD